MRAFEERSQEFATFKSSLKNHANETANLKKDLTLVNKAAKENDNEIYRVDGKRKTFQIT